jgi:hypothetical protein
VKSAGRIYRALGVGLAAALLAGCGSGSQSALPQGALQAQSRPHRASGSSDDLIYVTTAHGMLLVSYPDWKIVGSVSGDWSNDELCSDPNTGNVFVAPAAFAQSQELLEYAHGGTTPIATLAVPAGYTNLAGCSVDPLSGNLAVGAAQSGYKNGALLIYQAARGTPTVYTDKTVRMFASPVYDNAGDVFVQITTKKIGFKLAELGAGKNTFVTIRFNPELDIPAALHWDGQYVVFESPPTLYQLQIAGNTGTVAGTENVDHGAEAIAIQGSLMFGFDAQIKKPNNHAIAVWPYPAAGEPKSKFYGIAKGRDDYLGALAVSVAPSR